MSVFKLNVAKFNSLGGYFWKTFYCVSHRILLFVWENLFLGTYNKS